METDGSSKGHVRLDFDSSEGVSVSIQAPVKSRLSWSEYHMLVDFLGTMVRDKEVPAAPIELHGAPEHAFGCECDVCAPGAGDSQ